MIEITTGKAQGARVYLPEGISATISSQGGGQGAKTGLYAVQLGQGPNTRATQGGTLVGGDTAFTIRAGEQNGVMQDTRIRRLTPVECCRLQGFPDDWCDWGIDKDGKKIQISDTQKYRCLGNAVSTNVIARIISGWKELQEATA